MTLKVSRNSDASDAVLKESSKSGAVVLFTGPTTGVVVKEGGKNKVGKYITDWNPANFTDFDGKVTVSKEDLLIRESGKNKGTVVLPLDDDGNSAVVLESGESKKFAPGRFSNNWRLDKFSDMEEDLILSNS